MKQILKKTWKLFCAFDFGIYIKTNRKWYDSMLKTGIESHSHRENNFYCRGFYAMPQRGCGLYFDGIETYPHFPLRMEF